MTLKKEIMDAVKNLIEKEIHSIENILPVRASAWADTVSVALINNPLLVLKDDIPKIDEANRPAHIYRRLGQITVNPKDDYNTEALLMTYVYKSNDGPPDNSYEMIVNFNPKSAEKFIHELMRAAKERRKLINESDLYSCEYILYGNRGSGKTFFLNHIFSKFHRELDNENIIWVRVNLADNFTIPEENDHEFLITWIYAQVAKIIFRYYDPKSHFYDKKNPKNIELCLLEEIQEHIKEYYKSDPDRKDKLDKLVHAVSMFRGDIKEIPLTPTIVPSVIGSKVFSLAIDKGYSFIIVLDGLDRLEAIPYEQRKFDLLIGQYQKLIEGNAPIGMTIFAVMRTNTEMRYSSAQRPYRSHSVIKYKLESIDIKKIVEKRIDYLKSEVINIANNKMDYNNWPTVDWDTHLDEFLVYLDDKISDGNGNFHISLNEIFANNRRAQMQTIQFAYLEFLRKIKEKLYRVTEFLCRGSKIFPVKPYKYKLSSGKLSRYTTDERRVDHHLLPSIFLFPYIECDKQPQETHTPIFSGMLLGLRILQLVYAHKLLKKETEENRHEKKHTIAQIKSREVSEMLFDLFGYERSLTLSLIEEFAEYEFFNVGGDEGFEVPPENDMYLIYPMPKMEYILNKALYDIAYLNMCAMRVPLNEKTLTDKVPYFRACTYEAHGGISSNLMEWIESKILNTIGMFRLINTLNKKQIIFHQKKPNISERKKNILDQAISYGMFNFTDKLQNELLSAIESILDKMPDSEKSLPILQRRITIYKERWGNI